MSRQITRKNRPAPQLRESALERGAEAITILTGLLRGDAERATSRSGLSQPMAIALGRLKRLPEQSTVSALARSIGCNMGNLSGTLDRLEEAGYIERIVSEADRRARFIRLTEKGREIVALITENFRRERVCTALQQMGVRELETLTEMIGRLNDAARADLPM
jgi:DNA-binding MarR family transcriptional regulator